MCDDSNKKKGISRRKFLGGVSKGLVGSYFALPVLSAAQTKEEEIEKIAESEFEDGIHKVKISLLVNGKKIKASVAPNYSLADLLRNDLKLTGTKIICDQGECGGCTVVMNGKAVYSCHTLAVDADESEIITIEGLLSGEELHPVQQAFVDEDGLQCGYCTPGQIMAAYALLISNAKPSDEEILRGMSGNLCRCSAYPNIIKSVKTAAEKMG